MYLPMHVLQRHTLIVYKYLTVTRVLHVLTQQGVRTALIGLQGPTHKLPSYIGISHHKKIDTGGVYSQADDF